MVNVNLMNVVGHFNSKISSPGPQLEKVPQFGHRWGLMVSNHVFEGNAQASYRATRSQLPRQWVARLVTGEASGPPEKDDRDDRQSLLLVGP